MEADPMRGFIQEAIAWDAHVFTPRTDVYTAYCAYAAVNGFHQMSASRFYEGFMSAATDMSNTGIKPVTVDGYPGYRGLTVK